jgi:hypothetical protein
MNDNANPEPVAEPADAIRVTPDAAVYRGGVDPTLVVAGVAAAGVFLQGAAAAKDAFGKGPDPSPPPTQQAPPAPPAESGQPVD